MLGLSGSRYISGPDANTRPEDVVLATPVPEVTLPPQSRWGLRKREPAVVFARTSVMPTGVPGHGLNYFFFVDQFFLVCFEKPFFLVSSFPGLIVVQIDNTNSFAERSMI